jgi:hypothetical protein
MDRERTRERFLIYIEFYDVSGREGISGPDIRMSFFCRMSGGRKISGLHCVLKNLNVLPTETDMTEFFNGNF